MTRATAGTLLLLLAASPPAMGSVVVSVGDWVLQPNAAGQVIEVRVARTGNETVDSMQFNLQVADGGPEGGALGGPGLIDGPEITNVDILTGTIFAANNIGDTQPGYILPQLWASGTETTSGTVVDPEGMLATVTIDTTGFLATDPVTSWELALDHTLNGPSMLYPPDPDNDPIVVVIENGSITLDGGGVIPEPSTLVVWSLLGVAGAFLVTRRRRRAQ